MDWYSLYQRMIQLNEAYTSPGKKPLFKPGQIVHHRRYDYRGVIVAFDPTCQADEQWYNKNQTQPDRDQPWYHVLVHLSNQNTYVAQENLELDPGKELVVHPLLSAFFSAYAQGRYIRNETPWPG